MGDPQKSGDDFLDFLETHREPLRYKKKNKREKITNEILDFIEERCESKFSKLACYEWLSLEYPDITIIQAKIYIAEAEKIYYLRED